MSTHIPTPLVFYSDSRSIYDAAGRCLCIVTHSPKNGTHEEMVNRGNEIVRCINTHDALVAALRLVQAGLKRGNVKSKPIINFDPNAESMEMQSLDEIVDAAIARAEAAS